jgi:large subunit ribosomal protein L22
MQAKAVTKYVRISPLKVRPVMDVVRGMPVRKALSVLKYMPQKAAREVARTLMSAAATIYADEGPAFKRFMPRARGRADRIRKRTTHITVVVDDGATS